MSNVESSTEDVGGFAIHVERGKRERDGRLASSADVKIDLARGAVGTNGPLERRSKSGQIWQFLHLFQWPGSGGHAS